MNSLRSYEDWEHCITVLCGIQLTPAYLDRRLAELQDTHNTQTQQFLRYWGTKHHRQVMAWFEEARRRLVGT